ncbi:MAG TPA: sulfatase [Abditibacteriaceae bacterium]|jgi:arylsulfatase A-like enzyme
MRLLYLDIDSLRPDHLGCYGYHRDTSPVIDALAARGVRFTNFYVTDAPCLPSRSALFSGRCGFHTGVINHGGVAAQPFIEGPNRAFRDLFGTTGWMAALRRAGLKTVTVSPFGERHSAWHWYAGFNEIYNTGKGGMESAEEVSPVVIDWIERNARSDNWFLHVNLWDPHTPYRVPESWGNPFQDEPVPDWLTEEVRQSHWNGCGPHSAQEIGGFEGKDYFNDKYPRQPLQADSMDSVRAMFDGYDCGVRYADEHVGKILDALEAAGILDETVIIISSDHGENLGEFNIYGDHQTADYITTRVPLIVVWPGVTDNQTGWVDEALHYHYDFAATTIELCGGSVPNNWDGVPFTDSFKNGFNAGRDYLVVSQGAWSCQRSVRWGDYLCIRSYHDGLHAFPDIMLFDVKNGPHQQNDLASAQPDLVNQAMRMLDKWHGEMMKTATHPHDPMAIVVAEGGPLHTRGALPNYLKRLRETGRSQWAEILEKKHPRECR